MTKSIEDNWCPYRELGLGRNATTQEIKDAHRALIRRWHPDRPDGDSERAKRINLANDILSDTERRAEYDRTGRHQDRASEETRIQESADRELKALLESTMISALEKSEGGRVTINIVEVSIEAIDKANLDQILQLKKIERKRSSFERLAARLKGDIFEQMIDERRKSYVRAIEEIEFRQKVCKRMKEMIDANWHDPEPDEFSEFYSEDGMLKIIFR